MKTKSLLFILSFSFLLMSSYAFAFTTESGSINLNNINWNLTDVGVPIAPYGASVVIGNNTPSFSGNLACLDINLSTYVNTTYPGTWYTVNSAASVFNSTTPYDIFIQSNLAAFTTALNEAGWLANHMEGLTPSNANPSYVGPIDLAIWTIMLPYSTNPTFSPDGALLFPTANSPQAPWITDAEAAVAGGYTTSDLFFSPNDTTSQGYVLIPTPEPSTFLLFGAGIAGVAYLKRRKKA
jgi:hypothetical protein